MIHQVHINKSRFIMAMLCATASALTAQLSYPATRTVEVADNYHGTTVSDPYRWLENDRDPEVEAWVKAQNEVSASVLSKLTQRDAVRRRLTELWNFPRQSAPFKKGKHYFYFHNNGLQNQSVLHVTPDPAKPGTILLDPNTWSSDGTASINGLAVSKDGSRMAYGISRAGSDWVEIHFIDVSTKKELGDILQWVKFSGISWHGNGIFYSRYAAPTGNKLTQKNEFHRVYYHRLGQEQEKDSLVFSDDAHPEYNFSADVTEDGRYLVLYSSRSTSGNSLAVKDLSSGSPFVQLADGFTHDHHVVGNSGSTLYILTNDSAPRYRVRRVAIQGTTVKKMPDALNEQRGRLEFVRLSKDKLFASYLEQAVSKLYGFDLSGNNGKPVELPGLCRVTSLNTSSADDFVSFSIASFTYPERSYLLKPSTLRSAALFVPSCPFRSADYVTEQVTYKSKDGTPITMFMVHRKDVKPSPETPCFVYGYGGFNISLAPEFRLDRAVFLEAGGLYCVPNLRGGGEYGEEWHKAGTKCNKQNVFDDFIAACDFLVTNHYTSYQKIAIHGRSNGGLLVGAVITQRPDICRVAVPAVGVLDMLRFHRFTIGRAWTSDFGSSDNAAEFQCLLKYSPYHNLKKTTYPATLILTGDHDDRVVPAHSFKFTAAMQRTASEKNPVIMRVDINAGHGAGKPTAKLIDEFTDMWSFVFDGLRMSLQQ